MTAWLSTTESYSEEWEVGPSLATSAQHHLTHSLPIRGFLISLQLPVGSDMGAYPAGPGVERLAVTLTVHGGGCPCCRA